MKSDASSSTDSIVGLTGLSERDQDAYAYIRTHGTVPQSDLWKTLDVSSRTGTRIARRLVEAGLIEREETIYEGRRTYLLRPNDGTPAPTEKEEVTENGDAEAAAEAARASASRPIAEQVREQVQRHEPILQTMVGQRLTCTTQAVAEAIEELVAAGELHRTAVTLYGRTEYELTTA